MKFGFSKLGSKMRTNLKGMRDPAGAASQFKEMAAKTNDPKKAAKYEQLADQWGGTAMQGGFFAAMATGGLGVPGSMIQAQTEQLRQNGGLLQTEATDPLAAFMGQGHGIG